MRLKPVVLTLARLFELLSTMVCWAFMPVAAVKRARIMAFSLFEKGNLPQRRKEKATINTCSIVYLSSCLPLRLCGRFSLHLAVDALLHGVGQRAHGLGGGLVLTHARDHLHHFLDDLHVGAFAIALTDRAGE